MTAGPATVVLLDGQPHAVAVGTTLADLVAQLGHAPAAVATAVDGVFVPRERRAGLVLRADEAVLLFQPIVGG